MISSDQETGFAGAEAAAEQSRLRLVDLRKKYGETVAVEGVSLDIRRGEFLTLLGSSGSGKTTTLMMIAGFELPTSGQVLLDGKDISRQSPHRRGLGMVFQNYALFPHMTVAENVAYPLRMRKVPRAEQRKRVEEALARVHLDPYAQRRPAQLSGGQQQRVALARALVFNPPLLLMDEPFGALDKKLREQMQDEVHRLHKDLGVTIVFVTHDQEEALMLSDRIAVMSHGRIEQCGTPREIYDRPQTRFVAGFVGETNLFEGVLVEQQPSGSGVVKLDDGGTILATPTGPVHPGRRVTVAVRPENLRLSPVTDQSPDSVLVTVEEATYLGHTIRYQARTTSKSSVVIRQAGEQRQTAAVGTEVRLSWAAENAVILDPGKG